MEDGKRIPGVVLVFTLQEIESQGIMAEVMPPHMST